MSIASLATPDPDTIARRRLGLLALWVGGLVLYAILQFGMTERGSWRAAFLIDLAWTLASLAARLAVLLRPRYGCRAASASPGSASPARASSGSSARSTGTTRSWCWKRQTPFPAWSDFGYLGFPMLAIAGLLISIRRVELRSGFLRALSNLRHDRGRALHDARHAAA